MSDALRCPSDIDSWRRAPRLRATFPHPDAARRAQSRRMSHVSHCDTDQLLETRVTPPPPTRLSDCVTLLLQGS